MSPADSAANRPSGEGEVADDQGEPTPQSDDSEYPITRRQTIVGSSVMALLGTGVDVAHVVRPAQAVQPTVPDDDLERNGWIQVDQTTETVMDDNVGPVTVQVIASTIQYENDGLTNDIKNTDVLIEYRGQTATETFGDSLGSEFDQSMSVFAATKIDLTLHIDELPGGIGRAEVMDPIESRPKTSSNSNCMKPV